MSNFLVCIMLYAIVVTISPDAKPAKLDAMLITIGAAFVLDMLRIAYWRPK